MDTPPEPPRSPLVMPGIPDSRKRQLLLFAGFLLIGLLTGFVRSVGNMDEIWNYGFGLQIRNGLLPYRDFNYLQTPLSAVINAMGLALFGRHLVVIRALGALLFAGISITLYRIGRKLGGSMVVCLILPLLFQCLFYYNVFFEYSCLIVFFQLTLLGLDLTALARGEEPGLPWLLCTGVLAGLAILSKQTFGAFIAAASYLSIWVVVGWSTRSPLRGLRAAFFRGVGSSLPCFVFLFYLLGTGTLDDFLDMCLYGISNFSSHYSYLSYLKLDIGTFLLGILLPVLLAAGVLFALLHRKFYSGRCVFLLLIYGTFGLINLVPLSNEYHVSTVASAILLISLPLLRHVQGRLPVQLLSGLGVLAALVFLLFINPITQFRDYHLTTRWPQLEFTFLSDSKEAEMTAVCDYIDEIQAQGREIYVVDNSAQLYFLKTGTYHKYLDLFLNGNLGTKTPWECLEETLADGAVYLIPNEDRSNTQFPKSAVNSFVRRLSYVGTLEEFEIYEYWEE